MKRIKVKVKIPIEEALLRAQRIAQVTVSENGVMFDVMNVFFDGWYYFVVLANGKLKSYMPICKE